MFIAVELLLMLQLHKTLQLKESVDEAVESSSRKDVFMVCVIFGIQVCMYNLMKKISNYDLKVHVLNEC